MTKKVYSAGFMCYNTSEKTCLQGFSSAVFHRDTRVTVGKPQSDFGRVRNLLRWCRRYNTSVEVFSEHFGANRPREFLF